MMKISLKYKFLILVLFFLSTQAFASESVGTIDASNKLTKICKDTTCSSFGNINWKPTLNAQTTGASAVSITDTSITGHLWGDEIGWVNLSPTGQGLIVNPTTGVISGKAYSQTGSWIVFNVTGQSVTLVDNGSGSNFYGFAWVSGINGGWMKFDCSGSGTCIKTDWRRTGNRTTTTTSSGGGGGGGGGGGTSGQTTNTQTTPALTVVPPAPVNLTLPLSPQVSQIQNTNRSNTQTGNFSGNVSNNIYTDAPLDLKTMVAEKIYFRFGQDKIGFPAKKGSFIYGDRNSEKTFDGEFFRVPVGKKLSLAMKVKDKPKSIKTYIIYKGPILETRKIVSPKWSFWDRVLDLVGLKKGFLSTKVAEAETVPENNFTKSTEDLSKYQSVDYAIDEKGIYRSDIEINDKAGLYEFRTVVDYGNGIKYEAQNTSVVFDQGESVSLPEKYLFGLENNILATVTIYTLNEDNKFDLWNGQFYGQTNPVKTDDKGRYSVVVPPGVYRFYIEADGYHSYSTDTFKIGQDDRIINYRVSMACSFWGNYKCLPHIKVITVSVVAFISWRIILKKKKAN
jgi:hypothetical protein